MVNIFVGWKLSKEMLLISINKIIHKINIIIHIINIVEDYMIHN